MKLRRGALGLPRRPSSDLHVSVKENLALHHALLPADSVRGDEEFATGQTCVLGHTKTGRPEVPLPEACMYVHLEASSVCHHLHHSRVCTYVTQP